MAGDQNFIEQDLEEHIPEENAQEPLEIDDSPVAKKPAPSKGMVAVSRRNFYSFEEGLKEGVFPHGYLIKQLVVNDREAGLITDATTRERIKANVSYQLKLIDECYSWIKVGDAKKRNKVKVGEYLFVPANAALSECERKLAAAGDTVVEVWIQPLRIRQHRTRRDRKQWDFDLRFGERRSRKDIAPETVGEFVLAREQLPREQALAAGLIMPLDEAIGGTEFAFGQNARQLPPGR
jgi:hypothetical protein